MCRIEDGLCMEHGYSVSMTVICPEFMKDADKYDRISFWTDLLLGIPRIQLNNF